MSIRLGEHKEYTEINMKNFRVAGEIHLMRIRGISTDRPQRLEPEAKIDLKFAEYMFWIGVDWEGGVNQSARCNVDAEIQTAIKEWKEQAP